MPTCPDGHESASADFCDTCGMRIAGAESSAGSTGTAGAAGGGGENGCPQCGTARTGLFCEVCGFDFAKGTPASPAPDPQTTFDPSVLGPLSGGDPLSNGDPLGGGADPGGGTFGGADPGGGAFGGGADPGGDPYAQPDPAQPFAAPASSLTGAGAISTVKTPASVTAEPSGPAAPAWSAVVTADHDYYEAVIAAGGPDADSIEFPAYCPERRFTLIGAEMRIGRRSASRGLEPEIDLTGPPTDPGISHLHAVLIAQPDGTWSVLDPGSSNGTQVNGNDVVTGVATPLQPGDRVGLGAWTVLTIEPPAN